MITEKLLKFKTQIDVLPAQINQGVRKLEDMNKDIQFKMNSAFTDYNS